MSIKSLLEPNSSEDYLETAKAAVNFINTRKQTDCPQGIYWSLKDAATGKPEYYDELCFYAGNSGIICLLLKLFELTGDSSYKEQAQEAALYIEYRWKNKRSLKKNFSPFAFSTGYAGVCYALIALYDAFKEEKYAALATEIIQEEIKSAIPSSDGVGFYWSTYPGIVGTAGTVLFLLFAAKKLNRPDWKQFAIEAGKIFLNKGRSLGEGKKVYSGVDPAYFGAGEEYIDPNFPMGTAGIGFTLLRLYEESGDEVFLCATDGIADFMESAASKTKTASLLPHALPVRPNLFYLGYCHGPAGTCRYWYKLYKITGENRYLEQCLRFARGTEAIGAPEIRSEGYWNYNFCCGTAGLLNLYLGLWAENGEEKWLSLARRAARVLINGAEFTKTENGLSASWRMNVDRSNPERQTTPIGLLDGAAGIAYVLLQLYMAEKNDFHITRPIDDPFPESR